MLLHPLTLFDDHRCCPIACLSAATLTCPADVEWLTLRECRIAQLHIRDVCETAAITTTMRGALQVERLKAAATGKQDKKDSKKAKKEAKAARKEQRKAGKQMAAALRPQALQAPGQALTNHLAIKQEERWALCCIGSPVPV